MVALWHVISADLPRVVVVPHSRGWSYDFTAQALRRHLRGRFDISVIYDPGEVPTTPADLVVDMWWRGNVEHPTAPVLRQFSSHRWKMAPRWAVRSYARKIAGMLVPSERLLSTFSGVFSGPIRLCPKGFHPEMMWDDGIRRGPLVVGWAGNAEASDKGLDLIVEGCRRAGVDLRVADRCLTQSEMSDFYNSVDVIAVASTAEGDPRTLIEGMACGCYPMATRVGIVPELVRDGDNGAILTERTAAAIEAALRGLNVERARAAGRANAQTMLATRTWAAVAPRWGAAFDAALSDRK